MALDGDGRLYLLKLGRPWIDRTQYPQGNVWIKRFDPQTRTFSTLPTVADQIGSDARQVRHPANIAVSGRNLYLSDYGNRRIQVFDTTTLMLRHLWLSSGERQGWRPIDIATHGNEAYILDGRQGRVYRHRIGDDHLVLLVKPQKANGRWTRITIDQIGRIYLFDQPRHQSQPAPPSRLVIFDPQGKLIEEKMDSNEVRDRFASPSIRLFRQGGKELFCLPVSLMKLCEGRAPTTPPPPEMPLALCSGKTTGGLVFDRDGNIAIVNWEAPSQPKLYATNGKWLSKELDSKIPRCQWHRIELEIGDLPPGSRIEVSTCAGDQIRDPEEILDDQWDLSFSTTGPSQPPDRSQPPGLQESLIQSREGQYLWVRIQLLGDGYGSPSIRCIRAHYPRESYLDFLPAVYSADEESRRFLERFLSIFQADWDALEKQIDEIAAYFDPKAVPAGEFLAYLASWLALPLEGSWNDEQKRQMLKALIAVIPSPSETGCQASAAKKRANCRAPALYRQRGLVEGLRGYLRAYLRNMSGLSDQDQLGFPQIVEGFRERQRFLLSVPGTAELDRAMPLWSKSVVGRLQLGVFSREGEVRLVSTGDPERDYFHEFAHRFRVFVPAAWVRSEEDEMMIRRAIELEKPAHTAYDLCLVKALFRVGLQATIGIDTIVGAHPAMRLSSAEHDDQPASGRSPRLGFDTVLGRHPKAPTTLRLAPGARVGFDTVLN
jgi:hypothetical protein